MGRYYAAVVEMPGGKPSRVENATSKSELAAARAALRLANVQRCTTLVVERNTANDKETVTQRIQYFGGKSAGLAVVDPRD